MPTHPITPVAYSSLAELYELYVREFVQISPIKAVCGCEIHCYEHHFVHMVKLLGAGGQRIFFPDVKKTIMETTVGFGEFLHEERRAVRLLASLETLKNPDVVVRTANLATANRAFIKEFVCSQYPYLVVLVRKEEGVITLCTAQPTRKRNIKQWLAGERLFPKTPQPPGGVAV